MEYNSRMQLRLWRVDTLANIGFNSQGDPFSQISSPGLSRDTMAFIQKSLIHQPGVYGNQEHQNSHVAFNSAVNTAAQLLGQANNLRNTQAPQNYVRTDDNYLLTDAEKYRISNTSERLSTYGVVPMDTLETFFYTLASVDTLYDLQYISAVTGIDELGDQRYVRNISGICDIPDIYKVGYLAQGVSSVNQRYGKYPQTQYYDDYSQSSTGSITQNANYATSLGMIGMAALSLSSNFNGPVGVLSNAPSLSTSSILQTVNFMSNISSDRSYSIGPISPSTYSAVLNPQASAQQYVTLATQDTIGSLLNMTPFGGALSSFGALGGVVASSLLGGSGGNALGGYMSQVLFGTRMKTSQLSNNPMLTPPSFAGRSFFGEAPVSMPATDQVFCRRVGSFGSQSGGSGVVAFGMQNFASMGGSLSLTSLVSNMILGSPEPPPATSFMGQNITSNVSDIANILGVSPFSQIEPRRSDNSIPFLLAMSGAMVGEKFSPFGSKPFTDGWQLAASAANDIQKYNPQFLNTCISSL